MNGEFSQHTPGFERGNELIFRELLQIDDELEAVEESVLDEKLDNVFNKLRKAISVTPRDEKQAIKLLIGIAHEEIASNGLNATGVKVITRLIPRLEQLYNETEETK